MSRRRKYFNITESFARVCRLAAWFCALGMTAFAVASASVASTVTSVMPPSQVYLGYQSPYANGLKVVSQKSCSGALIGDIWVLTAAHCTENLEDLRVEVQAGDHSHVVEVQAIYQHPRWDSKSLDNDLALVQLETPQPGPYFNLAMNFYDDEVFLTDQTFRLFNQRLDVGLQPTQHDRVYRLLDQNECLSMIEQQWRLRDRFFKYIDLSKSSLCAASVQPNESTCFGDSGAPLAYYDYGQWSVIGINSWSFGCEGFPSVLTRVDDYRLWIKSHLEQLSMVDKIDFGATPEGVRLTKKVSILNTSKSAQFISLQVTGSSAAGVSLDLGDCYSELQAGELCSFTVSVVAPSHKDSLDAQIQVMNQSQGQVKIVPVAGKVIPKVGQWHSGSQVTLDWFQSGKLMVNAQGNNSGFQVSRINDEITDDEEMSLFGLVHYQGEQASKKIQLECRGSDCEHSDLLLGGEVLPYRTLNNEYRVWTLDLLDNQLVAVYFVTEVKRDEAIALSLKTENDVTSSKEGAGSLFVLGAWLLFLRLGFGRVSWRRRLTVATER